MRVAQGVAAVACILVGVAMVVGGVSAYSSARAAAGDRLIDLVAGELTDRGLRDHAFDLNSWERGSRQLEREALPWLANRAGMTTDDLEADVRSNVPQVEAAFTTLPEALPFARKILDNLERQQENFQAANDLPVPGLSLEAASWLLVIVGLLTATLGALALLTKASWPPVALVVVGILLILGPIVTSFPTKSDRASDLLETLNFDRQVAAQTRQFFETTRDLFASVDTELLPYVAERGGLETDELIATTHEQFPTLASTLADQDEIATRFEARVRIRERAIDDLNDVKQVPLRELGWLVIAGGGIVLVAGTTLLLLRRQRSRPAR